MNTPHVNRIICPVDRDFSAMSTVAARMAFRVAHLNQASVAFVHVVKVPDQADGVLFNSGVEPDFDDLRAGTANDAQLANTASKSTIHPINLVTCGYETCVASVRADLHRKIAEICSSFSDVSHSLEIRSGDVGKQTIESVETYGADMICMATRRGSVIARGVLGSVTDQVVKSSDVPVLLIHPDTTTRRDDHYFEHWPSAIVVPLDGSRLGETAIPLAVALAEKCDIPIHLVHGESFDERTPFMAAASESPYWPADGASVMRAARHYIESVRDNIATDTVDCTSSVLDLSSTRAIIDAIRQEERPLVVMSSHGRSGIKRLVLGSVSDEVVRNSGVPVIVIPPSAG